ncbi:MAG TPA: glycosyltransferase family 39 protein [Smithellaceae bacterium]|nr:glycosyltransferase family 39 protein [Smithellaceae bacterium]HRS83702.1 glycosyltransferase family 39 protein [Smithellaceae bacterium]
MKKKAVLWIVPFLLYVALLGVMPQMEPDEVRYSLIASAMNETGSYVTPKIKNTVYLEKPPLVSWVTAAAFKIFGENDFSARLFSGLCAWGCILLVFWIGRRFRDEKTGLYAAAVLTISAFPFALGRINILDMPLTLFLCLAIWLGYLSVTEEKKRLLSYGFYFACALAFLTKGMIGVVFPFAVLGIWLVWERRWRLLPRLISPAGIIIFLAVVCPWLYLAQKENPDFLWFFFVREHFLRFTTQMHGKTEPFYYFLPVLIGGTLPWSIFLIRAWQPGKWKEQLFRKEENRFLAVWFLFIFLFYTVSSSKLVTYIAPVFLPAALFAGCIFRGYDEAPAQPTGRRKILYSLLAWGQFLIVGAALLLSPIVKSHHDPSRGLVIMISDLWWIYLLPVFLAAGLMIFLPDWIVRRKGSGWFASLYLLCCIFLAGFLFPLNDFLYPYRSALVAKEAIARYVPQGKLLYQYRVNFYGIDFYNKIRTPIVEDFGELSEGIAKLPEAERKKYFLSRQDFFAKCRQEKEVYCITQHEKRLKDLREQFAGMDMLWENGAFYLLRIRNQPKD